MAYVTNYITDWFRIGNSGKTVDGRNVTAKDIDDMVASYSPEQYRANIWAEHERYYQMGEVVAVKATDNSEGGKTLWAKLKPNDYYLMRVDAGQVLSFSMEITHDYRGTGKAYLTGLGATDSPASWGTDTVKFTTQLKEKTGVYFGDYIAKEVLIEDMNENTDSLFEKFKQFLIKTDSKPTDTDMNLEQFNELKTAIEKLNTSQGDLVSEDVFAKVETDLKDAVEKLNSVTEKFTQLETQLTKHSEDYAALKTAHDELAAQVAEALQEVDGTPRDEHSNNDTGVDDDDVI